MKYSKYQRETTSKDYIQQLSLIYEGEIKAFPDKLKLKKFITRPTRMQKGALLTETKKLKYTKL